MVKAPPLTYSMKRVRPLKYARPEQIAKIATNLKLLWPELINHLIRRIPLSALRVQPWRRGYDPVHRLIAADALRAVGREPEADLLADISHPVYWNESGIESIPRLAQVITERSQGPGYGNAADLPVEDRQHLQTALWSSMNGEGEPLDENYTPHDIHPAVMASMLADWRQFKVENAHRIGPDNEEQAAHDFWLTRNRHGAGFQDRPELYPSTEDYDDENNELGEKSHEYGEFNLGESEDEDGYRFVTGDSYVPDTPPHPSPMPDEPSRQQRSREAYARVRYARPQMTPELLNHLLNAAITHYTKNPQDPLHFHLYADALDQLGRSGEAEFMRHFGNDQSGYKNIYGNYPQYNEPTTYALITPNIGGTRWMSLIQSHEAGGNYFIPSGQSSEEVEHVARKLIDQGIEVRGDRPGAADDLASGQHETNRETLDQFGPRHEGPDTLSEMQDFGEQEPERMSAYRAPAGGAIVRGTYYQGGKLIPDLEGKFANPPKKPLVTSYARNAQKLPLAEAKEYGVHFKTGQPVEFNYVRNTEKSPSPTAEDTFQQNLEPHGRYMLHQFEPGTAPRGWEEGKIKFNNPLVVHLATDKNIYGENGWKSVISKHYGRTGNALSKALAKDGYDGIVTVDGLGTSEILDLTMHHKPSPKSYARAPRPTNLRPGERDASGERFEPDKEPVDLGEFISNQYKQDYGEPSDEIGPETGFILENGYGVPMGQGTRGEDHRGAIPLSSSMRKWGWPEDVIRRHEEGTRTQALWELMKRAKALRVHVGDDVLMVNLASTPTNSQKRAILSHVQRHRPAHVVISHVSGAEHELSQPRIGEVQQALETPQVEEDSAEQYARAPRPQQPRPDYTSAINHLMTKIRSNPYEPTHQLMLADAVEKNGDKWLADLIRSHHQDDENLWYPQVENSWDGTFPYTARLGKRGPFNLYLGHEGNQETDQETRINPTGGELFHPGGGNQRYVLHVISANRPTRDTGFSFEFPYGRAHEISQNIEAARRYLNSDISYADPQIGDVGRSREAEAARFADEMDRQEAARP